MGWTFSQKPANVKQELRNDFTFTNPDASFRVLDDALVNLREYYAAVERTDTKTGEVRVIAFVTLVRFNRDPYFNFGTKEMTEEEGPYAYNCPEKILDLLTPTTVTYAIEWREKCRKTIAAKKAVRELKQGDTIKLETPVSFTNGEDVDTLHVVNYAIRNGRRRKGYRTPSGTLVRLPLHQYRWEKV